MRIDLNVVQMNLMEKITTLQFDSKSTQIVMFKYIIGYGKILFYFIKFEVNL